MTPKGNSWKYSLICCDYDTVHVFCGFALLILNHPMIIEPLQM